MGDKQTELRRFRQDVEYFEAHRDELLSRYPEQWVAIFKQQVVAADPDYDRVLDQLEAKSIPVGKVFIERATAKDELLILGL
jgi:hypothetical protein